MLFVNMVIGWIFVFGMFDDVLVDLFVNELVCFVGVYVVLDDVVFCVWFVVICVDEFDFVFDVLVFGIGMIVVFVFDYIGSIWFVIVIIGLLCGFLCGLDSVLV